MDKDRSKDKEILYLTGSYKGKITFDDRKSSGRPAACWTHGRPEDRATSIKGMIPGVYQDIRVRDNFDNSFCYLPAGKPVAVRRKG